MRRWWWEPGMTRRQPVSFFKVSKQIPTFTVGWYVDVRDYRLGLRSCQAVSPTRMSTALSAKIQSGPSNVLGISQIRSSSKRAVNSGCLSIKPPVAYSMPRDSESAPPHCLMTARVASRIAASSLGANTSRNTPNPDVSKCAFYSVVSIE